MTTAPFPDGAGYVKGRYISIAEATLPDWGLRALTSSTTSCMCSNPQGR